MEGEPVEDEEVKNFNTLTHNTKKLLVIQEEDNDENF
jgi:hypothetical protein